MHTYIRNINRQVVRVVPRRSRIGNVEKRKSAVWLNHHHHHLRYLLLLLDQLYSYLVSKWAYPPLHPNHHLLHHYRNNSHRNPDDPLILRRHQSQNRHQQILQMTIISISKYAIPKKQRRTSSSSSLSPSSNFLLFLDFSFFAPVPACPSKYSFHKTGGNNDSSRCSICGSSLDGPEVVGGFRRSEQDSISVISTDFAFEGAGWVYGLP